MVLDVVAAWRGLTTDEAVRIAAGLLRAYRAMQ
jgi:hypothetical protein